MKTQAIRGGTRGGLGTCLLAVLVVAAPAPVAWWLHRRGVPAEGIVGVGVYGFWLVAVPLVAGWRGIPLREFGLRREGTLSSFALALLLPFAVLVLAAARSDLAIRPGLDPAQLAAWAAYCLLLSGPAQELVFRGLVQSSFRRWKGPAAGLIASSLLYGLAHFRMGPAGMAANAVYGLFYGAVVLRTRNVVGSAAAHGLYNLLFGHVLATGSAVL